VVEQGKIGMTRRHVRERQKGNTELARLDIETFKRAQNIRGQIPVSQLDAF